MLLHEGIYNNTAEQLNEYNNGADVAANQMSVCCSSQ
jgi:hypothetical protein